MPHEVILWYESHLGETAVRAVIAIVAHEEIVVWGYDPVEVGHVAEPQQYAVADRTARVSDGAVMVLGPDVVQLQDEVSVSEQPLVLGAAVVAA